jgi:DegV family protein with EDD domain
LDDKEERKMRIITDDVADIPADLIEKYHIHIMPVNIMFGTEEFLSGITMDHSAFYEKVKQVDAHNFPKTSQPTPYQFIEVLEKFIDEGENEFLIVTVSQKLSGTYDSAEGARRELAGRATVHLFDSQSGSTGQGFLALEAARMAADGAEAGDILKRLQKLRDELIVVFMIDSLEYAVKGGRVGSLRSTVATLLSIKPIMTLRDGVIVEAGKVRTYGKALAYIVDFVKERAAGRPVKLAVIHAGALEAGEALLERARMEIEHTEALMADMALPVAVNLGPGALGIVALPEE